MIHWSALVDMIERVPFGLDLKKKKVVVTRKRRREFIKKHGNFCDICDSPPAKYMTVHHIIPNGDDSEDNLALLHKNCSKLVHLHLYIEGKWRYVKF